MNWKSTPPSDPDVNMEGLQFYIDFELIPDSSEYHAMGDDRDL